MYFNLLRLIMTLVNMKKRLLQQPHYFNYHWLLSFC